MTGSMKQSAIDHETQGNDRTERDMKRGDRETYTVELKGESWTVRALRVNKTVAICSELNDANFVRDALQERSWYAPPLPTKQGD